MPTATVAFFKESIKEVAKVYGGLNLELSSTSTDRDQKIRSALSNAQQQKILIAGLAAFSSTLLTKAVGSTLNEFMPKEQLESISQAVLKNALETGSTVFASIVTSLIKAYGDALDTRTGKPDKKKLDGAIKKITTEHGNSFKQISKSTITKLVDSII